MNEAIERATDRLIDALTRAGVSREHLERNRSDISGALGDAAQVAATEAAEAVQAAQTPEQPPEEPQP